MLNVELLKQIEVDEDEIVNAINEIKESSEVSKEVVMTISYFKGNTIYIWLTIIIIISYLLVSLHYQHYICNILAEPF